MNMIILCGLPGSGKSTICKKWFPNYERVSQDQLGSRQKCIDKCEVLLRQKKNVIIDRTNISKQQRKYWIDLGLEYGADSIICIYLDVNPDECVIRIHERKDHETIGLELSMEEKFKIVNQFRRSFEMPSLDEGFNSLIITRN